MNHPSFLIFFIAAFSVLTGCKDASKPPPSSEFDGRLKAALALESDSDRNSSLAICAENAAAAGEGEVVKKAIAAINVPSIADAAALDACRVLAAAGQTSPATEVAELISADSIRRTALLEIARGKN